MSAFVPKRDPNPEARVRDLEWARSSYQFNYNFVSPLAIIDRVPIAHEFSQDWMNILGERVLTLLQNQLELEGETHIGKYLHAKQSLLASVLAFHSELFAGVLRNIVREALQLTGRVSDKPTRPADIEDYARLFRKIGLPPVARETPDDRLFAAMRLGGPNPVMLNRIAAVDGRLPIDEREFQRVIPGDSLAAAGAEGRLFLADYGCLDGAELGDYPYGLQKYVYAPIVLFVVDRRTRQLRPVAIQCKQAPGRDNPIFTPDDGPNWLIAKVIVEVADGNVHEAVTHLARTHLLIEPFVVCTYRQLAPRHPLFQLLFPHFEGTLAINDAAWRHLISNKGPIDKLFGGSIRTSRGLAVSGVQSCLFNEAMLPRALASRGVADGEWLGCYPYRDDASLYWAAIRTWVADYLALFYPSDAELLEDHEVAAWLDEIRAEDGGRIRGIGPEGSLTVEYLVDAVTMIIYTCSVQHAAVNFPQYDFMSYVPRMPLAGWAPAPTSKSGATPADVLDQLPPLEIAELQMELGYMLGTVHYTTLGEYPPHHFPDPRVAEPLARFQARLAEIGRTIEERNRGRFPYRFLEPAGVPQSINI